MLGQRRLRRPRPTLPRLNGRYVYGDYCRNPLWSLRLQAPDAQDDRRLGLDVPGLTSFGEDSCGRVYAVSADGPVFRLEAEARRARPAPPRARRFGAGCHASSGFALPLRDRGSDARTAASGESAGSLERARGRVVAQSPRPGARRARGARVHLTVSRGRR